MSHRASRGSQGGSRADMSISSTPEGPEVGNRSPWPRPQDYICRLIVSSLHVFPTWPTEERASCDIFHPLGQCYGEGALIITYPILPALADVTGETRVVGLLC